MEPNENGYVSKPLIDGHRYPRMVMQWGTIRTFKRNIGVVFPVALIDEADALTFSCEMGKEKFSTYMFPGNGITGFNGKILATLKDIIYGFLFRKPFIVRWVAISIEENPYEVNIQRSSGNM